MSFVPSTIHPKVSLCATHCGRETQGKRTANSHGDREVRKCKEGVEVMQP